MWQHLTAPDQLAGGRRDSPADRPLSAGCQVGGAREVGTYATNLARELGMRGMETENLRVLGGIATMYDARTNLSKRVLDDVRETHGLSIIEPPVPRSVRVAEAPGDGVSVLAHAGRSKPAAAYRELAEVIEGLL